MTLRRYARLRDSRGTVIPASLRRAVLSRDVFCVGYRVGMPGECFGGLELDHIAGSGALGKKSPTVETNLVALCSAHHREKTLNGRQWRPVLLEYVARTTR